MPARNTSNAPAANGSDKPSAPPYWKVLDPIDGGYVYGKEIAGANGSKFSEFEINVFDDRAQRGQRRQAIQVQVRKAGKFGSTAVLTLNTVDEFESVIADLQSALTTLRAASKAKSSTRRSARGSK